MIVVPIDRWSLCTDGPYVQVVLMYRWSLCVQVVLVSWCGGELWVDQRKKCADICDVAQVTDIRTLPN